MLYEMATGARPFAGDTSMSVLTSILRDEPQPVTERNERLPRYLGRVIKRCLQKDSARRFQSALDLRNDLPELKEELASGELAGPGAQWAGPGRRSPRWLPLLVGLAIVAVLGVWWSTRRAVDRGGEVAQPGYEVRRLTVRGVDDLSEEQVTFFSEKQIFSFDVSPDRTRLAVGRGEVLNDLLLIEGMFGPADGDS